jgi:predicted DCC family thiol-disulfide oxidoreductase YuxK
VVQPEPPCLVYDGECGFCQRWARWLGRRVPPGTRFVAFQDMDDLSRYGLARADVERASYWVDPDGRAFGGNRSIAKVLQRSRGTWRVIGVVLDLPVVRSLAALAYRAIARNRHRLPAPR